MGWISLIFRSIFALICIMFLATAHSIADAIEEEARKNPGQIENENDLQDMLQLMKSASGVVLGVVLVFLAIGIICSIFLIAGAMKSRRNFIIPYLIYDGLMLVVLTLGWIFSFANIASDVGGFLYITFIVGKFQFIHIYI